MQKTLKKLQKEQKFTHGTYKRIKNENSDKYFYTSKPNTTKFESDFRYGSRIKFHTVSYFLLQRPYICLFVIQYGVILLFWMLLIYSANYYNVIIIFMLLVNDRFSF